MPVTELVLDASVLVKWFLDDDGPDVDLARSILTAWSDGKVSLVEPALAIFEVANVLGRAAAAHKRLAADEAAEKLRSFLTLGLPTVDMARSIEVIVEEAMRFNRAVYDMTYIVLGEQRGAEVVTADEKVVHATQAEKPFVKILRDYALPS